MLVQIIGETAISARIPNNNILIYYINDIYNIWYKILIIMCVKYIFNILIHTQI